MPPLPLSRSQIDKLSQRLRHADAVTDEDFDLLLEVLRVYQQALDEVQVRLREIGLVATTRTKTTSVLIDKLKRERTSIKSVQDIAGARIVQECDREEQDEIVAAIVTEFGKDNSSVKVKDRRAEPSHGYRAVHVVVTVQDLPVEIQIRTLLQDMWAQIVESLGDKWGRGIRYGEPPTEPARKEVKEFTRADIWATITHLSENIASMEDSRVQLNRLENVLEGIRDRGVPTESEDLERFAREGDIEELKSARREVEERMKQTLQTFANWAQGQRD